MRSSPGRCACSAGRPCRSICSLTGLYCIGAPTRRAAQPVPDGDVKWVWEAGRFGWAFTLGRAYRLCADERYPQAFWDYTEAFWQANPPYRGPHWLSAQEAALRLMALVFAGQVFAGLATQHTAAAGKSGRLNRRARRTHPAHTGLRAAPKTTITC